MEPGSRADDSKKRKREAFEDAFAEIARAVVRGVAQHHQAGDTDTYDPAEFTDVPAYDERLHSTEKDYQRMLELGHAAGELRFLEAYITEYVVPTFLSTSSFVNEEDVMKFVTTKFDIEAFIHEQKAKLCGV